MQVIRFYLIFFCLFFSQAMFGITFSLPSADNDVVGQVKNVKVPSGANITSLGQRYHVGYLEFFEANPRRNLKYLQRGSDLVIPTKYVLPNVPRHGIVINLAELRLYYYPVDRNVVITYPVGVGRNQLGFETPLIQSTIAEKRENPIWIPTEDTRLDALEKGITLPPYIAAGPENPLGDFAMRLGVTTYLIHGTNNPSGVGLRSSGGCIRMYPENVEELFHLVKLGTHVNIVDEPFKAGYLGKTLYLEAHVPIDIKRGRTERSLTSATRVLMPLIKKYHAHVNWEKVLQVANEQRGTPEPVGYR